MYFYVDTPVDESEVELGIVGVRTNYHLFEKRINI